jgi:hypothetical protein
MSARPLEPHAGQLTIVGLDQRLAAPWLRLARRAHALVCKLSRRLTPAKPTSPATCAAR